MTEILLKVALTTITLALTGKRRYYGKNEIYFPSYRLLTTNTSKLLLIASCYKVFFYVHGVCGILHT